MRTDGLDGANVGGEEIVSDTYKARQIRYDVLKTGLSKLTYKAENCKISKKW